MDNPKMYVLLEWVRDSWEFEMVPKFYTTSKEAADQWSESGGFRDYQEVEEYDNANL